MNPFLLFLILSAVFGGVYFTHFIAIIHLGLHNETMSHILIVPFISAFFILREMKLFSVNKQKKFVVPGIIIIVSGVFVYGIIQYLAWNHVVKGGYFLSIPAFSAWSALVGLYVFGRGYIIVKSPLFKEKRALSHENKKDAITGIVCIVSAGILYGLACFILPTHVSSNDYLSIVAFTAWMMFIGIYIFCFGYASIRLYPFPFLFLLLAMPLPGIIEYPFTYILLYFSAKVTEIILVISGITFVNDGFLFHLQNISVLIADECSGIRSTLAMFLVGIIIAHLYLNKFWKKLVLIILLFPIAGFKNGVRIAIITILAEKVDKAFITNSFLHNQGGFFFFLLGFLCIFLVVWVLSLGNRKKSVKKESPV